jgi:hypothetical protein
MTRIEKSQINLSAFIILSSNLKKVKSDRIVEIVNDGKGIVIRQKEEGEKENFEIDLNFLDELFKAMVTGHPGPVIVNGEAEQYLRNCSYACYYYRNENERKGEFDHFDLFHNIHFPDFETLNINDDIVRQFCRLFRIDENLCMPFIDCQDNITQTIKLPEKEVFNQVFSQLTLSEDGATKTLTFESYPLKMNESLDTLFSIKDLLSCRKIDTSKIPEYNWFSIQQDEEVIYSFTINEMGIEISFMYKGIIVKMNKN